MTLRLLTESLRANGWGRIHLSGRSMLPTLRDGWKVRIRAVPPGDLRVGDVAAFVNRGVVTVHRLVWKKRVEGREEYIFQGDNSAVREAVDPDSILGRVESAEGEWTRSGVTVSIPIGRDERAFFYRNAYRLHAALVALFPSLQVPGDSDPGGFLYRTVRTGFRLIERIVSPRPLR